MKEFLTIIALCAISIALVMMPAPVSAEEDGTGMDGVFHEIGWTKPAQWGSWKKQQKHSYLRSIGLYPAKGKKYSGNINPDLTDYFAHLDTTQPGNWDVMTPAQRKTFVDGALVAQATAADDALKAAEEARKAAELAAVQAAEGERAAAQEALKKAQEEAEKLAQEKAQKAEEERIRAEEAARTQEIRDTYDGLKTGFFILVIIATSVAAVWNYRHRTRA